MRSFTMLTIGDSNVSGSASPDTRGFARFRVNFGDDEYSASVLGAYIKDAETAVALVDALRSAADDLDAILRDSNPARPLASRSVKR